MNSQTIAAIIQEHGVQGARQKVAKAINFGPSTVLTDLSDDEWILLIFKIDPATICGENHITMLTAPRHVLTFEQATRPDFIQWFSSAFV